MHEASDASQKATKEYLTEGNEGHQDGRYGEKSLGLKTWQGTFGVPIEM